jgi:hypothetical protein
MPGWLQVPPIDLDFRHHFKEYYLNSFGYLLEDPEVSFSVPEAALFPAAARQAQQLPGCMHGHIYLEGPWSCCMLVPPPA